ncbi:MAG: hypothetical protein ACREQV_07630 [Candidatus Binatia bacterium]
MEVETTAFHYRSAPASRTGENSMTVMQTDVVAAPQYADDRRGRSLEPEKSLMLAILEDALRCFQDNHLARCGNAKRIFHDAQQWLFGAYDDWVFSFENICAILGFDPQYIQRGLLAWEQKQLSRERAALLWERPFSLQ